MKHGIRLLAVALLIAGAGSLLMAATLTSQQRAKIHPDFQALLATTNPELAFTGGSMAHLAKAGVPGGFPLYHATIHVDDPSVVRRAGVAVNSSYPGFVTAIVSPGQIVALARTDRVQCITPGWTIYPTLDVSVQETGASLLQGGFLKNTPYKGSGAIVLIYDTGIDWKHLDFRSPSDPTKSRILFIWDQTLSPTGLETPPAGFSYGVEYTQAQINAELSGSPPGFVREKDLNGHGTHVAGIAAGNGLALNGSCVGMAPDADIIVVKGGEGTFNTTEMIDGLTYANIKASGLGKPVVLNWSLGTLGGPHDGTTDYEVATNTFVASPGHVVVASAGNDGGDALHIAGTIGAGSTATITLNVPAYTPTAGTLNDRLDFDVWFKGNPTITAKATSPGAFTATALNGQTVNGSTTTDGTFSVYNMDPYLSNGHREVELYVRDADANVPRSGTWTLALSNTGGSAVAFDGWLDARAVGANTVSLSGGDVNETVGSPGNASGVITVASYVTKFLWPSYVGGEYGGAASDRTGQISLFSSIGPTSDGRQKPDIAAPGEAIASALSSFHDTTGQYWLIYPDQKHWVLQGTSMAAPHVTGAVALLLSLYPSSTASDIKTLLSGTTVRDAYTGSVPNATWGYGKLDILQAVANKMSGSALVTRHLLQYDGTQVTAYTWLTGSKKIAVRVSPAVSGTVTGFVLQTNYQSALPVRGSGSLVCEVYSDNGGVPGTKLGSSVAFPLGKLNAGIFNYIQMLGAGVSVTGATDVHVVVSTANLTDSVAVLIDNVTTGTRSNVYNVTSWSVRTYNFLLRAIVTTASVVNSVEQGPVGVPIAFDLEQNYPNPFNPSTRISYTIGERGLVTLEIFDLLGREVATLVNESQAAGSYQIVWNGRNSGNLPVTSGVYFCRLRSGGFSKTNRMVLLK